MANTYLTYTQQSPSTAEGQKFTLSMWVKKCANGTNQGLWGNTYSNTHRGYIYFDTSDRLAFYDSGGVNCVTTRLLRDNNCWYHILVAVNTTLGGGDRIKFYINGVRETSFSSQTEPNQNETLKIMNTTNTPTMGKFVEAGTSYYLQGVIAHAHLTQGYVYDATPFGETDTTTGEWKIKTAVTGVTYGTNGFWWLKDTIATTDHSPNSNTFTVGGGTLTKTEDCPANVFATMNPLNFDYANTDSQLLNGNTFVQPQSNGQYNNAISTLAMPKGNGKFYAEAKYITYDNVTSGVGIIDIDYASEIFYQNRRLATSNNNTYITRAFMMKHGYTIKAGSAVNVNTTFANGDIFCIACDMENGAVYFRKNDGAWISSGDPTSGASRTGAVNISGDSGYANSSNYAFWCGSDNASGLDKFAWNFGNGYFQTTAVATQGTNASGNGIFEYDVPSGYTALSTKGLNI
jgi:hypothetical protein